MDRHWLRVTAQPYRTDANVMTEYKSAVRTRWTRVEETGNELSHASRVRRTELRLPMMVVAMNVQNRRGRTMRCLENFTEGSRTDACTDRGIVHVVGILNHVPSVCEK